MNEQEAAKTSETRPSIYSLLPDSSLSFRLVIRNSSSLESASSGQTFGTDEASKDEGEGAKGGRGRNVEVIRSIPFFRCSQLLLSDDSSILRSDASQHEETKGRWGKEMVERRLGSLDEEKRGRGGWVERVKTRAGV